MQIGAAFPESNLEIQIQNLKNGNTPLNAVISFLGITPEGSPLSDEDYGSCTKRFPEARSATTKTKQEPKKTSNDSKLLKLHHISINQVCDCLKKCLNICVWWR